MRVGGEESWRIRVRRWEHLIDCALWIRAAERIEVPEDRLVPGPADIDPPPPSAPADAVLGAQWRDWWRSLVATPRQDRAGTTLEPAVDTPDPLGLAPHPALRDVVARHREQANLWHSARSRTAMACPVAPTTIDGEAVRQFEREAGRRTRPFDVEFLLLPVRDDVIRRVDEHRYLVPERVYDGRGWPVWLRTLLLRIG